MLAWPKRGRSGRRQLEEGATVADDVAAAQLEGRADGPAAAVQGGLARPQQLLLDGDRVELLGVLHADPTDNRRRRARGG